MPAFSKSSRAKDLWQSTQIPTVYAVSCKNNETDGWPVTCWKDYFICKNLVPQIETMIASSLSLCLSPFPAASGCHPVFLVAQVVTYWTLLFCPRRNTIAHSLRLELFFYIPIPSRPSHLIFPWKGPLTLGLESSLRFKTRRVNSMTFWYFKPWQILKIPWFRMQI